MSNLSKGAPAMASASRIEPRDYCRKPFRFYLFVILTGLLIFARPLSAFALEVASPTSYPGFNIGGHGIYGVRTPLDACYYWNGQYGWTFRMTGEINVLSPTSWNCPRTRDGMTYDTYVGLVTPAVCPVTSGGLPYVWNYKTGYCERSLTCNTGYKLDAAGTSCIPDVACPANMSGSPCACNPGGYVPNPNGAGCILEQYILELTISPADKVMPSGSASISAKVVDAQKNGKSGVTVSLKVDVDVTSGGHDHGDAQRPKGTLETGGITWADTASRTTGADGTVSFTFGAPGASGTHTFTAACVSHACTNKGPVKIDVKVPGLEPIPPSGLYALYESDGSVIGATKGRHPSNHYLTPEAANRLLVIAINYHHLYPKNPVLHVNDASLMWGGVFDIDTEAEWNTPHEEHMRGTVVDIRANLKIGAIPPANFDAFIQLANDRRVYAKIHSPGETNQHFHVRLLNRSE